MTTTDGLSSRLEKIRREAGLSLREFARLLQRKEGYSVTHDTVRRYERGGSVPTEYVLAVSQTFELDPEWLLVGRSMPASPSPPSLHRAFEQIAAVVDRIRAEGDRKDGDELQRLARHVREGWISLVGRSPPGHPLRSVILESWRRSHAVEDLSTPSEVDPRRVSDEEFEERLQTSERLIRTSLPHLSWARALAGDGSHLCFLTDADGVVLHVEESFEGLAEEWNVLPGSSWSEAEIGTNGPGTALAAGRIVAVIGPEHYRQDLRNFSTISAPVHGPDRNLLGSISLMTTLGAASPEQQAIVAYVAVGVERDLGEPAGKGREGEE